MEEMIEFEVNQEDIDRGIYHSPDSCPVANSLKRKFPKSNIIVTYRFIFIDDETYYTTQKIADYMYHYEYERKPIKPAKFLITSIRSLTVHA